MNASDALDGSARTGRPHVVALCGSRRAGSHTRQALVEVLSSVDAAGGSGELLDLAAIDLPPLDPTAETVADAQLLADPIRQADAVVLGTPMYHGSYSGMLKNAIDHCGIDEFEGTTVGLLAVSGGPFPTAALAHLRAVCRSLHAWVLPHQVAIPHSNRAFDGEGFTDESLRHRVRTLGEHIVQYAVIEPTSLRPMAAPGV